MPELKADLASRMSNINEEEVPQEADNTETEDSMEVDKSDIEGAPSKIKPSGSADPSNSDLLSLVDTLFTAADKHTMTVGGVYHSVATHFGWKIVDKTRQKVILKRLKDLINGIVSVGEGLDDEKTKKKKDEEADLARRMNTYEEEGEDDRKQPAVISPKKRKKEDSSDEEEAELEGDLEGSDDEQPKLLQPRQLGYSSEKKKRRRILDDSDDE